jgi:hypothetical protein
MRLLTGLLIIAAGIILLLNNLDVGVHINIKDWWPVILIVIGIGKISQPKEYRQMYWGIVIAAVGTLFLLNNLEYISFWFGDLWPVLIILLGIEILRCGLFRHSVKWGCCTGHDKEKFDFKGWGGHSNSHDVDSDFIDLSIMLGGGEYKFTNKKLKGGQVSVIMAGCELDLRDADMEEEQIVLETSSVMGGIELRVPAHWYVIMQGSPILGGMEDKTSKPENPTQKLVVKGSAVMGAVEVKN